MGNCLEKNNYWKKIQSGDKGIFSLRDSYGNPHVTIDASKYQGSVVSINQIKGNANTEPKPKYSKLIKVWISKLINSDNWDTKLAEFKGNFVFKGELHRIENLPDNFVLDHHLDWNGAYDFLPGKNNTFKSINFGDIWFKKFTKHSTGLTITDFLYLNAPDIGKLPPEMKILGKGTNSYSLAIVDCKFLILPKDLLVASNKSVLFDIPRFQSVISDDWDITEEKFEGTNYKCTYIGKEKGLVPLIGKRTKSII